jgi:hypothetical protein
MTNIPEASGDPLTSEPTSDLSLADQLSLTLPHLKAQADAAASIVRETILRAEREASSPATIFREAMLRAEREASASAAIVREAILRAEREASSPATIFREAMLRAEREASASAAIVREAILRAEREASASAVVFAEISTQLKQARTLRQIGWIPHPVLPIQKLAGSETEPNALSHFIRDYINNNSETLYSDLMARFADYSLERGTYDLCEAVIKAHRSQLFPLIVLATFSEIEYCARDALGFSAAQYGKKIIDNFIEKIFHLPVSRFHFSQLETLILMRDFMYESTRVVVGNVTIPHRHGSQHGIVRYFDSQTCLNAIFLLDFVLRARDVMRGD